MTYFRRYSAIFYIVTNRGYKILTDVWCSITAEVYSAHLIIHLLKTSTYLLRYEVPELEISSVPKVL